MHLDHLSAVWSRLIRGGALANCCASLPLLAATPHWQPGEGHRGAALVHPSPPGTGFTRLLSAQTGLAFTNRLDNERSITNRNLLSGSGVAAGDVDGDGLCDLFFCGLDSPNALFRNLGGWRFTNLTTQAGVACAGLDSTAAVFADLDGDRDLDLIVNTLGHGPHVFRNDGTGRFTDVTEEAGVRARTGGMSLALADVDGDNDLDLYVVNYRTTTIMDHPRTTFRIQLVNGQPQVAFVNNEPATAPHLTNRFLIAATGEVIELGEPDVLYLNDGQGRFSSVSWTDGAFLDEDGRPLTDPPRDWGLSVQMRDLNDDGAPDIYVCNDLFSPDRFWINDGKGRFRAVDRLALRTTSTFSMGVDFGDLDRDGDLDFMIVDMLGTSHKDRHTQVSTQQPILWGIGVLDNRPQVWRNTLHVNRGDTTFAEVAFYAGVEASNWSWTPLFLDVDLDGFEDVLIPNGQMRDFQNVDMQARIDAQRATRQLTQADIITMVAQFPDFSTPSVIFRNHGDWTFEEMQGRWGFADKGVSQGTTLADLDNDGDLDVIVNRLNDEPGLYRNNSTAPRVAVRLRGPSANTQGIGAKVVLEGGPVRQSQEIIAGGHYLSGADPMRVFAAGTNNLPLRLEVRWRDGRRSVISEARPNHLYEVDAAGARAFTPAPAPKPEPLFVDISDRLGQTHHEDPFDDFARQPLLPQRLSQLGPGVAWHDFDEDGWEDLVVASGRGGAPAFFRNTGAGQFDRLDDPSLTRPAGRDQTSVLGVGRTVFFGSANYEDGLTNGGCIRLYDLSRRVGGEIVLGPRASTGPLAFGDVDGDGTLELFVGGRVIAGRHPEPADSLLLRNDGGRFAVAHRFERLGLVSGAVFSDLDGDALPELLLACEWGPIRIFRLRDGRWAEWDPAVTGLDPELTHLAQLTGWWNGVTTGDLDGDGRLDILATNWGLNHRLRDASPATPRYLYFGDLDGSGDAGLIEAYFSRTLNAVMPTRGFMEVRAALPFIQERVTSFEAYGTATLEGIYGERLKAMERLAVTTPASLILLNRGDRFEARPLPPEAQWSPAFGVAVTDLDGDGTEDVLLSQNFFAVAPDLTRQDAGRGLMLRGDGRGNLTPVPGQLSGIQVYGEQRGCALGDFDQDGRVDAVLTQNGAATKLYRNVGARPGLRVRLIGPPGNPAGFGAVLRLGDAAAWGPAREVHGGSGYWSLDAATQVLAFEGTPTRLEVRWPGGALQTVPVPARERSIVVDWKTR